MARKKSTVNKDAWLQTYSDMITLILVFFILLFSISTIDQEKYRLLVKAFTADPETLEQLALEETEERSETIQQNPGAIKGSEQELDDIQSLEDLYQYLSEYIEKNGLQESVEAKLGKDAVYVRFMSTLFFEPDSAILKPGGNKILNDIGPALHRVEQLADVIKIDGHTAESAGSSTDDRELSTDRANAVLKYLEKNYIADPAKLVATGYGRYRPIAPNDNEANMQMNRRVEILVSRNDAVQEQIDEILSQADAEIAQKEAAAEAKEAKKNE